ncbi:hypothetical protein ACJRO7_015404 [Eucalyptus globulus]|uniref:Uncharacterized protein n=1 Tax=Eucalyptus globulus TaxID=34317 RepID=A0ABD3L919_EUCGL
MATRRTTSKLTKTALAAINAALAPPKCSSAAAGAARALSRSRSLSSSAPSFRNSVHLPASPPLREANVLASSVSAGAVELRLRFMGLWPSLSGLLDRRKRVSGWKSIEFHYVNAGIL